MKRLAQFVALILVLLAGAEPVLAGGICTQRTACGKGCTAVCCGHPGGMTMGVSAPRMGKACEDRGCCRVSAANEPMIIPAAFVAAGPTQARPAVFVTGASARVKVAKRVGDVPLGPGQARYLLYREFRI